MTALAEHAARAPGDHERAELQRGLMTSVRLPPPASETTKGDSDLLRGSRTALDHFPPGLHYERHFVLCLQVQVFHTING